MAHLLSVSFENNSNFCHKNTTRKKKKIQASFLEPESRRWVWRRPPKQQTACEQPGAKGKTWTSFMRSRWEFWQLMWSCQQFYEKMDFFFNFKHKIHWKAFLRKHKFRIKKPLYSLERISNISFYPDKRVYQLWASLIYILSIFPICCSAYCVY